MKRISTYVNTYNLCVKEKERKREQREREKSEKHNQRFLFRIYNNNINSNEY